MSMLDKKWYIQLCTQGEDCWCRMVSTDPISDDMDYMIACSGELSKEVAEHIVELHNTYIEKIK